MRCIRVWLLPLLVATLVPRAGAQTLDSYDPHPLSPPTSLAMQADGKLVIVGGFLAVGAASYTRVARLNVDGSVDATFVDPNVDSEVKAVAVQADGKLLIGGSFTHVGGAVRHSLARLNANGTLDTSFADTGLNDTVWALAVQPDGKVLAGGDFDHVGATARNYLARFAANGSFDSGFADPQLCCLPVRAVALQSDGHVLVGGYFSQAGGIAHFNLARYSGSGAFDPSFPNVPDDVPLVALVLRVAPDDSVYVSAAPAQPVVRLHADGSYDPTFVAVAVDEDINSIMLQPDGRVLIGGTFEQVGGQPRHALARLGANGALDAAFADLQFSFDAGNPNGYIYGIAAQADGRIIVNGNFTLANGQARAGMARINSAQYAMNRLAGQAGSGNVTMSWTRGGAGAELVQAPLLQRSSDGTNFATVATMMRIAGGWRATTSGDVHGAPFYLRALGTTADGAGNASRGQVVSRLWFSDAIFADGFD